LLLPDALPSTSPATQPSHEELVPDVAPVIESFAMWWPSEADCADCAHRLACLPELRQAHIALYGNLGAGKTTWVRHLLRAQGVVGRIKSPSYTIVEPYDLPDLADSEGATTPAWHFDFYRFADPQEWEDAGLRDIFASPGLKLVEWPQRAAGLLPPADLDITLTLLSDGASRSVQVGARSLLGLTLLHALT
jgi:tRNA threonylcarbamoyladenosine biosynthesis protein TsaE